MRKLLFGLAVTWASIACSSAGGDDAADATDPTAPTRSSSTTGPGASKTDPAAAPDAGAPVDPPSIYATSVAEGIATYYDASGKGSCSFDASPDDLDVVALNFPEFASSAACGSCIHIRGALGEVTVRVVDSCPGCEKGHLDLSETAFTKIDLKSRGKVKMTYQTVACAVTGNVGFHVKGSKFWTAIQVRNHRIPITKLEYLKRGAWTDMPRSTYNYFIATGGVGDQPNGLAVRVTGIDGQVLEQTLPGTITDDSAVAGTAQFK